MAVAVSTEELPPKPPPPAELDELEVVVVESEERVQVLYQ